MKYQGRDIPKGRMCTGRCDECGEVFTGLRLETMDMWVCDRCIEVRRREKRERRRMKAQEREADQGVA